MDGRVGIIMTIRFEHGRPETFIAAAKRAGIAKRAQERADRLEAIKMEADYKKALKQQDIMIDLQMRERAKLWEIEKMEITSRMDFERSEATRQRELQEQDLRIKALTDAYRKKLIPKDEYEALVLQEKTNLPVYNQLMINKRLQAKADPIEAMIAERLKGRIYGGADVTETTVVPPTTRTIPTGKRTVIVKDSEGNVGPIPAENLDEALARGATIVSEVPGAVNPFLPKKKTVKPPISIYKRGTNPFLYGTER